MKRRYVWWVVASLAGLALAGFAAWVLSLPAAPVDIAAPPIERQEADATVAALEVYRAYPANEQFNATQHKAIDLPIVLAAVSSRWRH